MLELDDEQETMTEEVDLEHVHDADAPEEKKPEQEASEQAWHVPIAPVRPNVKPKGAEGRRGACRAVVTVGTMECGLACGALFVALGALLLWIGFWKTLFIAALGAVGVFVGAVDKKSEWLKDLINRLFPPRS